MRAHAPLRQLSSRDARPWTPTADALIPSTSPRSFRSRTVIEPSLLLQTGVATFGDIVWAHGASSRAIPAREFVRMRAKSYREDRALRRCVLPRPRAAAAIHARLHAHGPAPRRWPARCRPRRPVQNAISLRHRPRACADDPTPSIVGGVVRCGQIGFATGRTVAAQRGLEPRSRRRFEERSLEDAFSAVVGSSAGSRRRWW